MTLKVNVVNKKRNPKIETFVLDHLELSIGRFDERILRVNVHIVDESNGKGSEDKICSIDIKLIPRGQLHVRAKQDNIYSAIVKATHRAESVVEKAIEKGHRGHETRHRRMRDVPIEMIGELDEAFPLELQ
jgi:ribosome-associated translation inhibitor RaiA